MANAAVHRKPVHRQSNRKTARPTRPARKSGGRQEAKSTGKDATSLLEADHKVVRRLLRELENAEPENGKRQVFAQVEQELLVHSAIEEEMFYPAFHLAAKSDKEDGMYYESHEEHASVDRLLVLMRVESEEEVFAAQCKVLREQVEHHAGEEEKEMFHAARRLMDKEELVALGERMAARKAQLKQQGVEALRMTVDEKVQHDLDTALKAGHGKSSTEKPIAEEESVVFEETNPSEVPRGKPLRSWFGRGVRRDSEGGE